MKASLKKDGTLIVVGQTPDECTAVSGWLSGMCVPRLGYGIRWIGKPDVGLEIRFSKPVGDLSQDELYEPIICAAYVPMDESEVNDE